MNTTANTTVEKFTPGPWVLDLESVITTRDIQGNIVCDAPPKGFESYQYWPDNAKLIAAAPDLYEALKELLDCDYTSGTHLYTAQLRAKAAIKKATE